MFERFTDRARRVVVLAQEEARMLSHNYIGTEHLLLGLLHEDQGMAAQVLDEMGISLTSVREQVLEIIGSGDSAPSGHIPFTPRAKKVLELSLREALQLGTDYIGTEHLLLGLLREGEGVAPQILVKLGKNLQVVREAVITIYRQPTAEDAERRQGLFLAERPKAESAGPAGGAGPAGTTGGVGSAGARLPMPGFLQSRRSGRPAGFPVVREYGTGLANTLVHAGDPVLPRQAQLEQLIATLARRERNNALIVGPSGAGKSALVRGLGQELAKNRGPASLNGAAIFRLEPPGLRMDVGRPVPRSLSPIAFVEDLDLLLGADDPQSGSLILGLAALAEAEEPLVITATPQARELLESRFPTFAARLEPVELAEADTAYTYAVLELLRPGLQGFHTVTIEDSALTAAITVALEPSAVPDARARVLPGAAVDALDAAAARLAARRDPGSGEIPVLGEEELRRAS
jgi:ATP-dependent Clp protease ATP-binding subunit ClpC